MRNTAEKPEACTHSIHCHLSLAQKQEEMKRINRVSLLIIRKGRLNKYYTKETRKFWNTK